MLGFRGASRYYDPRYRDGFALECQAMRQVRDDMGLTNVKLIIPFCRTVEEGKHVLAELATHGLQQGQNGLGVYVMCEIPSNVILAADFANGAITPCQYGVYAGVIPPKRPQAITTKARATTHIERFNLTLRQCISQ